MAVMPKALITLLKRNCCVYQSHPSRLPNPVQLQLTILLTTSPSLRHLINKYHGICASFAAQ
jgi:hypothetical protein